jgi:hypothetical protein
LIAKFFTRNGDARQVERCYRNYSISNGKKKAEMEWNHVNVSSGVKTCTFSISEKSKSDVPITTLTALGTSIEQNVCVKLFIYKLFKLFLTIELNLNKISILLLF